MNDYHADGYGRPKYTLDQPITYQIKIAGEFNENWSDWLDDLVIRVETDLSGFKNTTLVKTFDQAGLQGLLRRLYSLGFSIISVHSTQPN